MAQWAFIHSLLKISKFQIQQLVINLAIEYEE